MELTMIKTILNRILVLSFLIISLIACNEKSSLDNESEHTEAIGLTIYYQGEPYFKVLNAKIDTTLAPKFYLQNGTEMLFEVKFIDEDGKEIVPTEASKNFAWIIDDTTIAKLEFLPNEKYKFKGKGLRLGETQIEFRLNHYDHPDFKTPKVPLEVR